MRAHHVHVEHHFEKPPERIFAYLAEHENLAEVFGAKVTAPARRRGRRAQRGGLGAPAADRAAAAVRGDRHASSLPNERIVYRITKGSPLRGHVGVMTFEPADGGTRFVYDIRLASSDPRLRGRRARLAHALDRRARWRASSATPDRARRAKRSLPAGAYRAQPVSDRDLLRRARSRRGGASLPLRRRACASFCARSPAAAGIRSERAWCIPLEPEQAEALAHAAGRPRRRAAT